MVLFSKLKEKNPRRDGTNGSLPQTKMTEVVPTIDF
jgi:hypothetical protein